jgi:ubiquinone/menaquinone biosynthesis C-methylase UbiE
VSQSGPSGDREHYSYTHYADAGVAEGFDELRFSGAIGRHLLETQERLLLEAFSPLAGRHILDVGTGTGRAAIGLAKAGAIVRGLDASRDMIDVAEKRAAEAGVSVAFGVADAQALPLGDREVDATVCWRVLMHVVDWRRAVAELCRVSRWRVAVDFPSSRSVAAIESAVRARRLAAGKPVEAYRVLAERDVRAAFDAHGFRVVLVRRQFVLPISLHKQLDRLGPTLAVERALAAVGLLSAFGSPATVVAER